MNAPKPPRWLIAALPMTAALLLAGCQTPSVSGPVLTCPAVAQAAPQAEPAAPETTVAVPEPWRRWLFAEVLPWARQNARAREETATWCATLTAN